MSLKDQAKKDCPICKGSGQDTRTTGFTAVCECVEADQEDFRLLEEYDMKDKLEKTITHCLIKVPEANRKQFIINLCNGMIGSAILHHNNRYVKKLIVPDFKTTFK